MTRLSAATCDQLPGDVERPRYDRGAVRRGVVHLGIGAFHRAHQAVVFEAALAAGDPRWGITAASLRSPGVRDDLVPQDNLYTVVTRDGAGETRQVIGAVQEVLVAPENPAALVARLAYPDTHIVTLTVTEKGYKLDPGTGAILRGDPDIAADLVDLTHPRTVPGFLVAGLAARRAAGLAPFTAISCDNMAHNGRRLEAVVDAVARAHDPALADWIAEHGAFPETMVDRIVPATTEDDIAALAAATGLVDRAMVKAEPFRQWVIEDRFAGPRPDFASFGVQLTKAVEPWEQAKLRLLNGAHSAMAYLGGLAGIGFIHDAIAHPAIARLVEMLWNEAAPTLSPPPELDLAAYRRALLARFANPALRHRTHQIATDGSQKLPQRVIVPISSRLTQGASIDALALVVAAWMRWQSGEDDEGMRFDVDDPLAASSAALLAGCGSARERVAALLSIEAVFPARLAGDERLRNLLTRTLEILEGDGAIAAIEHVIGQ